MIKTLKNIFQHTNSRNKVLFTIMILLLIRLGSQIPTYGINSDYFNLILQNNASLGFFNSLTGNSFSTLSIFTLSIAPYITASIVIQLLTIAIPKLEEISKDGPTGKEKMEKITYITAGVLGFVEALSMSIGFGRSGMLQNYTWYNCLIVTVIWGTCALLVLWFAKLIDKKGIGSGISLILLSNILCSLPSDANVLYQKFCANKNVLTTIVSCIIVIAIALLIFAFAIILNTGEKNIPVTYSGKIAGNKSINVKQSSIPLKVCITGVMPVIFASSIMSFPIIIANLFGNNFDGVGGFILKMLNSGNWFHIHNLEYTLGYIIYVLLVIFFGYFYVSISFNSIEIANNLKRNGGVINGVRPGAPTVEYINKQIKYLTFIGTAGLLIIATIPMIISGLFELGSLSFGGTSIMIIVSVVSELKKKVETETFSNTKSLIGF